MPVSGPPVREPLQTLTFQRRKAARHTVKSHHRQVAMGLAPQCRGKPGMFHSQVTPALVIQYRSFPPSSHFLSVFRYCHHMAVCCCQCIGEFSLTAYAMPSVSGLAAYGIPGNAVHLLVRHTVSRQPSVISAACLFRIISTKGGNALPRSAARLKILPQAFGDK